MTDVSERLVAKMEAHLGTLHRWRVARVAAHDGNWDALVKAHRDDHELGYDHLHPELPRNIFDREPDVPEFGRTSWSTLGDLVDELIELADEIDGVELPRGMAGTCSVWLHTTGQVQDWLRRFASTNDLWHEPLPPRDLAHGPRLGDPS